MCIPYYTGMVIDILGEHYQPNSFMSAIFLMGLLSLGRYIKLIYELSQLMVILMVVSKTYVVQ